VNYERRRQVEDLFEAVLDLDAAAREAHVAAACEGDPELLAEVHAMLAAHDLAEKLLADPRPGQDLAIGPYRVLR
jgi:hypothetical protein